MKNNNILTRARTLVSAYHDTLHEQGAEMFYERGHTENWVSFMDRVGGSKNIAINHSIHPMDETNSGWSCLFDFQANRVFCANAHRVLDTDNMAALIQSGKIWWTGEARRENARNLFHVREYDQVAGRVSHVGGAFILPEYRGSRLQWVLTRLTRAIGFVEYGYDHQITTMLDQGVDALGYCGFKRNLVCGAAVDVGRGPGRVFVPHISAAEWYADLDRNITELAIYREKARSRELAA